MIGFWQPRWTKICLKTKWNMISNIPGSPPSGDLTGCKFMVPNREWLKNVNTPITPQTLTVVFGKGVRADTHDPPGYSKSVAQGNACVTGISWPSKVTNRKSNVYLMLSWSPELSYSARSSHSLSVFLLSAPLHSSPLCRCAFLYAATWV